MPATWMRNYRPIYARRAGLGHRRRMGGKGFFGDLWDGIKRGAKKAANWVGNAAIDTHNFVKKNKLVSRGLSFVPGVGGLVGSVVADKLGYGRRRRIRRRRYGGALQVAKPVLDYLYRSQAGNTPFTRTLQYASQRLRQAGHRLLPAGLDYLSRAAASRGWGRRRRVYRRRGRGVRRVYRRRGRGIRRVYRRRGYGVRRVYRRKRMSGRGLGLSLLGNLVHQGLKNGRYISRGLNVLRSTFPSVLHYPLKGITKIVHRAGYGRKRKAVHKCGGCRGGARRKVVRRRRVGGKRRVVRRRRVGGMSRGRMRGRGDPINGLASIVRF